MCILVSARLHATAAPVMLPYLDDRLHLTPEGHRLFGDAVAKRL